MVLYHTFYFKVFGYLSIGIYEVTGGLLMKIGMLVGPSAITTRDFPLFRSFFLRGMPALLLLEFFLRSSLVPGVFYRFTRRNRTAKL